MPPFTGIRDEHYRPAFDAGMAEHLAEVRTIAANPAKPTIENTLIALERSGQLLTRVATVFFSLSSSDSTDFGTALEEELAPLLTAHADAIRLDPDLYARICSLYSRRSDLDLDPETDYLLEQYHTGYTLAGAALSEADKATLREFIKRLSTLATRFEKNLLADTNELALVVENVGELDGLSDGEISAAAEAAKDRGLAGSFVITLVLPTSHPYLATLTDRRVRERLLAASRSRGIRGGRNDNRLLVLEITRLRAQRARLLGFPSHAAYVTADETAKTPEAVADMLGRLAPAAARNAQAEQQALQAAVREAGEDVPLAAWDWAFYTEKVRRARYDVDRNLMRPYFEPERVLHDGVFYAATRLYGVTFTERPDLTAWNPEARVFEVAEEDGSPVGLYIADIYTRDSKRGGA